MTWVAAAIGGSAALGAGASAYSSNQQRQDAKSGRFRSGGADERIYATRDFQEIYGRPPTEAELSQIVPAYVGADQHTPDIMGGKAYIASLYQNKKDIASLGESQDAQNQQYITQDAASRSASRDALAKALTTQGQAVFQQGLPQTEETLNAQHLLNGSGLGQELGRQQGYLATNIANAMGVQGAQDINRTSDLKQQALQSLQGFGNAGLGRQFSLEDFIRQSNVAKDIGASAAPQVGNGKGSTGTLLGGIGSLAPLFGSIKSGGSGKGGGAQQPLPYNQV